GFADEVTSEDAGDDEPDERARAYAAELLSRISARGAPAKYAGLVVTAALRGAPRTAGAAAGNAPANRLTVTVDAAGVGDAVADAVAAAVAAPNPPPVPGEPTQPAAAGTQPHEDITMPAPTDPKAILAADKARRDAIRNQFQPFASRADVDQAALATLQRECEDDHETTPEAAGAKLLALLGRNATPSGGHQFGDGITQDETATYREGAIHAVLARKDPQNFRHDERSQSFRGMNLLDLGRDCLERAGRRTRGLSRQEIAVQALQSTSDFPHILENVITKTLRRGYEGTQRTFLPWTRQATLPDFKQVSRDRKSVV